MNTAASESEFVSVNLFRAPIGAPVTPEARPCLDQPCVYSRNCVRSVYGSIELTNKGREHAIAMVRRHRLLETFLVQAIGCGCQRDIDLGAAAVSG